jgi:hypothetical protein
MHNALRQAFAMISDGIKWGLFGGLLLSAIVTGMFVLSLGAALDHSITLLAKVIVVYLVGGAFAGTVVSLLLPLARWTIGAALIGACAVIPAYGGVMIAFQGPRNVSWADLRDFLTLAAAIGAMAGMLLRYRLIKRGLYQPNGGVPGN